VLFSKINFFYDILKKTSVSKKKLKMPRIAPMLHFNYQIKILASSYNSTTKLVLV
jgi:hypothetical protein